MVMRSVPALIVCLVLALVSITAGPARAETVRDMFDKGVKSYNSGKYEEAAGAFSALVERFNVKSPDVMVNLGAAEFATGRPGIFPPRNENRAPQFGRGYGPGKR
ncbi:MAG: hypothetical protein GXP54_09205 [Deltaproteobacteria bacterium]|nr:hypothetical protein [Deltaproteobacteria bacterium]